MRTGARPRAFAAAAVFSSLLAPCGLPAGGLRYRITDPAGEPIPAKLTIRTKDGRSAAKVTVETSIPYWASRGGVVYTLPGEAVIPLPEGKYRVYVSHGFEWSLAVVDVDVPKDPPASLEAVLERVVDTRGFVSGDMHLHTLTFSGHGDTTVEERIITLSAENVEWAVATDHNHVTDYVPYVKKLGAERWIRTTPGNEVTTTMIGHFNAFPFNPAVPPTDWRITDPRELFRRMRAEGAEVVQVNHPRWTGARGAYFRDLDVSPWTGDSANPLFSHAFDSFEVLNGNDLHGWAFQPEFGTGANPQFDYSVREDWYNFLNMGLQFTAVGNSDSHHVNTVVGGCPRNFIRSSTDDPEALNDRELMAAVRAGALSVSTGIFVEASGGKGPDGGVAISIRVQAAPWIRADRLVVVANGEEVFAAVLAPPSGKSALRYEGTYRDRPVRDTWYIAYATGDEAPVPVQHETAFPLGFTNPIRFDADGDGQFTPLREHARRTMELALRSQDFSAIAREAPSFRRQALGALRDLETPGAAAAGARGAEAREGAVRALAAFTRDPDASVRAGAAELLALRPERSALLALLDARALAAAPEDVLLDFQLVRAGHLAALSGIRAAYARETGFRRYTIRRDILELSRKVRVGGWNVSGPYPSPRWEEGLARPCPPEWGGGSWRPTSTDKKGYLNFRDTMDPRELAAAYARLTVRARESLSTCLLLESQNALTVLLGGREVYRQGPRKESEASLEMVPVSFDRGETTVLVKSTVERGAWGFVLRAIDPGGALAFAEK